jgi:hypothetical protein
MLSRLAVFGILVLVLSACRDNQFGFEPHPTFEISDATTQGGNPYFRFLAEIGTEVLDPSVFNADLAPTLEICRTQLVEGVGCQRENPAEGHVAGTILVPAHHVLVNAREGSYRFDLKTNGIKLETDVLYRIFVRGGTRVLGYADVRPVNPPVGTNSEPGIHRFNNHGESNLEVRFRIDEGAVCYSMYGTADCSDLTVNKDEGGDLCIQDDGITQCVIVGPGAWSDDVQTRVFSLRILSNVTNAADCLDTLYRQALYCYRLFVDPPLPPGETFTAERVWTGYCIQSNVPQSQYGKHQAGPGGVGLRRLVHSATPIPFDVETYCDKFQQQGAGLASRLGRKLLHGPLAFVFGRNAYAWDMSEYEVILILDDFDGEYGDVDDGNGGGEANLFRSAVQTRTLSVTAADRINNFGWVRIIKLVGASSLVAGNTGTTVNLRAQVTASHEHEPGSPVHASGVEGVMVAFACTSGPAPDGCAGASPVAGTQALSNHHGYVTTGWAFTKEGTYTFEVSTPGDGASPIVLTAVIESWQATFLTPLVSSNPAPLANQNTTASGSIRISCLAGTCLTTHASHWPVNVPFSASDFVVKDGNYQVNWTIGEVSKQATASAGDKLRFEILLNGSALPGAAELVIADDPKYKIGSRLPIKWRIERP